jgi:hypothetical protein
MLYEFIHTPQQIYIVFIFRTWVWNIIPYPRRRVGPRAILRMVFLRPVFWVFSTGPPPRVTTHPASSLHCHIQFALSNSSANLNLKKILQLVEALPL